MNISLDAEGVMKAGDAHVYLEVRDSRVYFQKTRESDGHTIGHGQFTFEIDAIALQGTLYIPISIASGKKATGFVYQIEGTAAGDISTADISCRGEEITQVTLGTLLYAKIPQGSIANFQIVVHIEGGVGKEYRIVINRVNYKLNPSDARYKKFNADVSTRTLRFK